ncbi:hypothetical protein [Uliginosibacterium aquaticum]|uniref:Single-stranded DNA-binding protein n=1 Tax=Uliginosibacterium aquaticum TaxID=2731212 RepID=A0ABX2ILJ8_9RHOO|nr:hypothetical protein [Uliginosibacterium aquaticum]NSL54910.1 hypothetical protein [Uliginosibacterium aquaticum]
MSNVYRLQVFASEIKASQKDASRKYQVLQCGLHAETFVVGEIRVYGDLAKEPIQPGDYFAEFNWGKGFGDNAGQLIPRLVGLNPAPRGAASKPAQAPAA